MEASKLRLENNQGKTVRTIHFNSEKGHVIVRKDNKRIEIVDSLESLEDQKIPFLNIGLIEKSMLPNLDFVIPGVGSIKANGIGELKKDILAEQDDEKKWWILFGFTIVFVSLFVGLILTREIQSEKIEKELKQEVVKIIKQIPIIKKASIVESSRSVQIDSKSSNQKVQASVKRIGALAVLGSMATGSQKGGLNLGATKVTAGPGLGGAQGSGGVQTTLYGKGLVAAPLGVGNNLKGGGGYGTQGKGGGKAGYGTMSLIGSSGVESMPLAREATVGGGLDKSLIADVIARNLGQVRFCYEQGLQGNPSLAGRVAVSFTIGAEGLVKTSNIENSTLGAKGVEDCIMMRLRTWKFPLPEGGVDVKVTYPFVLKRTGQG